MPFAVWGRSGPALTVTHQNAASIDMWGDTRGQSLAEAPVEVRDDWERQIAEVMTGQIVRARREQILDNEPRVLEDIIAPVIVDDRVIGAVGVALDVTQEARAARFQTILTEISADCASRSSDALDPGLVLALEKIARFIGAPIAILCEIDDQNHLHITHWWLHPATGRDRPRFTEVDARDIRPLLERVAMNTPVVVHSRDQLPEGSQARQWLQEHALQSFAMVPARQLDGTLTLLGLAGANDQPVDWPADTVSCMRVVSTLLGGVLARARAEVHQKAVERRMQETQRLESLGVLAGGIAHDFNNLLTAILGNASLLRAEFGHAEGMASPIEQIEAASRRAAELCRQMLAFAGRGRFSLQLTDINVLVRDMQALLQVTLPRRSTLTFALAPSIPSVLADESQLRQLVMNLVINAAEALGDEGGTITVQTATTHKTAAELAQTVFGPQLSEGEYVSLSVTDTGSGMTPDTVARIFDPFYSTKFTGRGLGLASVVGIVRAHKGALRVDSRPGAGSTFELILPAQHGNPVPPPEALSPASHASLGSWQTTGTALVVDDEPGVREVVRSVLERLGMTVVVAEDGERGIAAFRRLGTEVRVVLVDFTMPGLDGLEALDAMRQMRADVPAVLMSGYSPADLVNASTHVFLQKPFTPKALRAALKRALNE
jgi:signal transduction histidine kinase/CheY-like chemotaxis protein